MPTISKFYGVVISMYLSEHGIPHFHATYAEWTAVFAISDARLLAGKLPPRALRLVRKCAHLHRDELTLNWSRARSRRPALPIDPLP